MGYGSKWGTNWGSTPHTPGFTPTPGPFASPIYPIVLGVPLGNISTSRFSGVPTSGLLSGFKNGIFFSPSLLQQNNSNEIDISDIKILTRARDNYSYPKEKEWKVFSFGPSTTSRSNGYEKTQPLHYAVTATMVETTPPGPTTITHIV